jgi:peptidoglycan/xylan/chitin deacetylase (PgdA/CDA1 family)
MLRTLGPAAALCIALGTGYLLAAAIAPPSPGSDHPTVSAPTPMMSRRQDSPTVHPWLPGKTTQRVNGARGSSALKKGATVVSLTFDDGSASEYSTLTVLRALDMRGTFYINTAMVNSSAYYMTWPQIADLAAAGNEIAGHTMHHVNLTGVGPVKERSEVCDDRSVLVASGLDAASFAYPEGARNASAEKVARSCGYLNARITGGLWYPGCGAGCPAAESIPPANRYAIRTAPPATTTTTLADLQASVTTAEAHGGGWVPMVFHGICDDRCTADNSLSPGVFAAFLDWLAPRRERGTVVRTVAEVLDAE